MKKLILAFAFAIAAFVSADSFAANGMIQGTYEYDGEPVDTIEVKLFKVAEYKSELVYEDAYSDLQEDISKMTNSELGEYALALEEVSNTPLDTTETEGGKYGFYNLEDGIYLVTFENATVGDYEYVALPIILSMPDSNKSRQVNLNTKTERECVNCSSDDDDEDDEDEEDEEDEEGEATGEEDDAEVVDTRDIIIKYIVVLAISIVVEAVVLYSLTKGKKGKYEEK